MFSLKNKKIVVTGAHGFLGQHVVDNLLVKRKLKKSNIFLPASSQFDLRKWEDCEQVVMGKDLIINLAARVGGIGYNRSNPGSLFYDNLMIGAQMMEAARQAGVKKFISLGTVCAYPKVIPIPFREEDLWSGYPEETNAPYGLAKKMQLVQAQAYRNEYNFNVIYLLLVNLFGPGDDFDEQKSHVIPALIKKIHSAKKNRQDSIVVWGDGSATREFLFVKDAAEAVLLAAEKYDHPDPVNVGTGKEIKIKDLVKLICKLIGYRGRIIWDKSQPNGQPRRNLNVARAKREFSFSAQTSLDKGLKATIDWYLNKVVSKI